MLCDLPKLYYFVSPLTVDSLELYKEKFKSLSSPYSANTKKPLFLVVFIS